MDELMSQVKDLADRAAALSADQDHLGSLSVLTEMTALIASASDYQKLKQSKLEAYLNG